MSKTSTATKKTEGLPELPAKQQDMNEILSVLKPAVQAKPERFLRTEHQQTVYGYKAMANSSLEDHLAPIFWMALAEKLNPLDEIIVREECGAWRAELLVRSIGPDGVDLVAFHYFDIGGVAPVGAKPKLKDSLHVEYTGNHSLWAVYDGDKQLVANIPTEIAATNWLANNDPHRPTA